ncbi:MAG: 2'-5' RNA ligase family protein [Actinomycetota bacterium]|nr:2'-5' RNA ligase family protein [Actinomycetota bacterium]
MSLAASAPDVTTVGVSIPIPAPFGPDLQARRASYGDPLARVTPAHITLLGPTEIGTSDLPHLEAHLGAAAREVQPFVVVLRGTGTFRPLSDVVFVQVARGISGCEQLELGIRKGSWGRELAFPYHPHVTVAHDVPEQQLDRAFDELADYVATFEVAGFHLYVQDGGGAWAPVHEFSLGEADG